MFSSFSLFPKDKHHGLPRSSPSPSPLLLVWHVSSTMTLALVLSKEVAQQELPKQDVCHEESSTASSILSPAALFRYPFLNDLCVCMWLQQVHDLAPHPFSIARYSRWPRKEMTWHDTHK
jgi:hypothetical protein